MAKYRWVASMASQNNKGITTLNLKTKGISQDEFQELLDLLEHEEITIDLNLISKRERGKG